MTSTARAPRWLPPLSLLAIVPLVWLISFSSRKFDPFTVTGQALLLIIILRAFCYWPPMVRWVTSMPIPHRVVLVVLVGSMILGHYTLSSRTFFPYVSWEIFPFVREDNPVTCREFVATTESGHKKRLLVEQLFPSIVQVYPLESYPPDAIDRLARALAKAYNAHHADDPVWRVDLMELAVQLHPPPSESRAHPSCELIQRYDVSSGQ
jgi:hypothetical protein